MPACTLTADELLESAFGAEEFGKTGHSLAGHSVDKEDVDAAADGGSSLLYGELLPAGVAQLQKALGVSTSDAQNSGPILELGMGTGKVALQLFLSLHRDVYGVELAPSRWRLADNAAKRLTAVAPDRFRYELVSDQALRLEDTVNGCVCTFVIGSLLDTPTDLLVSAAAVVMEVCLPSALQRLACEMLQKCKTGCRVVCYAPIHGLADNCRLAPVRWPNGTDPRTACGDGAGGLSLAASWKPAGHGFAFYELAATAEASAAAWTSASIENECDRVCVDGSGNPSLGRNFKHTDAVLDAPKLSYGWAKGDQVLVGYSWLPFWDLGNPGDTDASGVDSVHWMPARVVSVDADGYVTVCYEDEGEVEDGVHPERIRKEGCVEERVKHDIDWGDF